MAPWVPTRKKDIERLLPLLSLWEWKKFLEIGTGDGRVSYAVAKEYPHAKILWIELAFPVYIFAYLRKIFWKPENYDVELGNAFQKDFWEYDVIYVYGMPAKMSDKIVPKFMKEAKNGSKLYSYVFSIPDEYNTYTTSYGSEKEARIHVLEKK